MAKVKIAENSITECIKSGELKVVDIDSIENWKKNPRKFTKENVEDLAEVLKIHGQVTPVVVWKKDNQIRKGNRTRLAMKHLGNRKILCLFVDFPNEIMANSYGLADNKLGEGGIWDDILLSKLMKTFEEERTFEYTGFSEKEILSLTKSDELPDELPNVDTEFKSSKDLNFIYVRFENENEMNEFRSLFHMSKTERIIPYARLKKEIGI